MVKKVVIFDLTDTLYSRLKLYDDVVPILKELKANKWIVVALSNLDRQSIDEILENFGIKDYFDVIVSAKDYDTLKPDPRLINIVLTLVEDLTGQKVDKKNVWMIGDRPDTDIKCGKLAGINTIRVLRGAYAHKQPEDAYEEADYTIKFYDELYNILKLKKIANEENKKTKKDEKGSYEDVWDEKVI